MHVYTYAFINIQYMEEKRTERSILRFSHPLVLRNEITVEKLKDLLFLHKNLVQLELYEEHQKQKIQPRIFIII